MIVSGLRVRDFEGEERVALSMKIVVQGSNGHMRTRHLFVVLILGILFLSGCTIATVRPIDPITGKAIIEQQVFSAADYVEQRWESQVLPYAQAEAVPFDVLLEGLRTDRESTELKYGVREGTNAYNFLVTGTGTVLEVDTSSLMGLLHVEMEGINDAPRVSLQIGPVIRGTALRDAVPFIDFDQFTNQIEFANVSNQLHMRVREDVLSGFGKEEAVGKKITFYGAFTLDSLDVFTITPVNLRVGD